MAKPEFTTQDSTTYKTNIDTEVGNLIDYKLTAHASSPFATTSGASVSVSGIPAWAKIIIISLYRVSSDGTADALSMQIGDSGGLHTTGYNSVTGRITG